MNATVIFTSQNSNQTKDTLSYLKQHSTNTKIHALELELSDLNSVVQFVKQFKAMKLPLDILICNAGCCIPLWLNKKTKQGFEYMYGVNFLGHFLLCNLLMDELVKTRGRLICVASESYVILNEKHLMDFNKSMNTTNYGAWASMEQYALSKVCNFSILIY